jgi:hypothetical protein
MHNTSLPWFEFLMIRNLGENLPAVFSPQIFLRDDGDDGGAGLLFFLFLPAIQRAARITNLSPCACIVPHMRYFATLILTVSAALFMAPPVFGHAVLLSATPSLNQPVHGPDVPIALRFNSRIDAARSRIQLVAANGDIKTLVISTASTPDLLNTEARGLPVGSYVLRWQVLAMDGHITRGELPFEVR